MKNSNISQENNKRIAKNTLFLYVRMGVLMFISLYMSRVLLDKLGIEDYGIYNVIGGMTAMFAFFSSSLSNATQRFLNIELGRNCLKRATLIFQQHFTLYLVIILCVIAIAEPTGIWMICHKLVIPENRIVQALWVFQFTLISLFATFMGIVFNSVIVSHENMKIYSFIGVVEGILKLLICYLISLSDDGRLLVYGSLHMIVTFTIQGFYAYYCLSRYSECKVKLVWNKPLLKETTSIVGWNTYGTAVHMINDTFINILLNMFFGPAVNAARAISYQINAGLSNFTSNFYMSVRPQLMKNYAKGDLDYLRMLLFHSTRYSIFLLMLMAFPIMFCINPILHLWLKEVPLYTNIFSVLIISYSFICVAHSPLWDVALASGNIKRYQLIGDSIFLLMFPISYIFLKCGYEPTVVFYVMITVRICFYLVSIRIVSWIAFFRLRSYLSSIYIPVLKVVLISLTLHFLLRQIVPDTTVMVFVFTAVSLSINMMTIYLLGINSKERSYFNQFVMNKILRR